jgi:hypothetical protein
MRRQTLTGAIDLPQHVRGLTILVPIAALVLTSCGNAATGGASATTVRGEPPPEAFLDERVLVPSVIGDGASAADLTVAQVDEYYRGAWRKIDDNTYAMEAKGQDELTHKPWDLVLEFKPGNPNGICNGCTPNEQFIKINRAILNGDEEDADDIGNIVSLVYKANMPLPAAVLAARQQQTLAPACDSDTAKQLMAHYVADFWFAVDKAHLPRGDDDVALKDPDLSGFNQVSFDKDTGARSCGATAKIDVGTYAVTYMVSRGGSSLFLSNIQVDPRQLGEPDSAPPSAQPPSGTEPASAAAAEDAQPAQKGY